MEGKAPRSVAAGLIVAASGRGYRARMRNGAVFHDFQDTGSRDGA